MDQSSRMQQIMQKVGNSGRYQVTLIVLFGFIWYQLTSILLGSSFIFMNPIFSCSFSKEIVDQSIACSRLSQCTLVNSYTIVGHMELYCDRQAQRSLIQSTLPIGSITGLFLMNTVADIKGRKWTMLLCLVFGFAGILLTVVSAFANLVPLMVIAQVLAGFGGYPLAIITYVVFYDICSDHMRQQAMIVCNMVWGMTEMSFFIFDKWFNTWYLYLITINVVPLLAIFVVTLFFMVQSPNYLLQVKKDVNAAIQSLEKIAQYNQKDQQTKQQMRQMVQQYTIATKNVNQNGDEQAEEATPLKNTIHLFKKLLGNMEYLKPVLLLSLIYIAGSLFFYSIEYSLDDIGMDYSYDMLFLGIAETISFGLLQILITRIERMRRVRGLAAFYLVSGLLGLLFFFKAIQQNDYAATILVTFCRFFSTFAYAFFAFLQTESFPSDIQSSGAGFIESLSQIGTFFCPYILTALIDAQIYPLGVISAILITFAIVPALFLRETRKQQFVPLQQEQEQPHVKQNKKSKKKVNKEKKKQIQNDQNRQSLLQSQDGLE